MSKGNITGLQLSEQILGTTWKFVIRITTQFKNSTYNNIALRSDS